MPDFRFRPRNPSSMCRPSGALGWAGHGLSTASPRRPTEAARILYAFFGKAKAAVKDRGVVHFCTRQRPARFWFPYAGMPDLVVRPAKSGLRLKIAGCPSRSRTSPCGIRIRRTTDIRRGTGAAFHARARPRRLALSRGGINLLRSRNGAPGRTRTSCLRFRKPPLCPYELREQGSPEDAGARPDSARSGCVRGPSERPCAMFSPGTCRLDGTR